jgi:Rrf2 family protein
MKLSEGVEWAAHACVLLGALPPGVGLPAAALAEFHGLPQAYMAKQMQALARSGVVEATRGVKGGYRLSRPAAEITLWDVVEAIEGPEPAFRCSEIRQTGACGVPKEGCKRPCEIASIFHRADAAWRAELKATTIGEVLADVASRQPQQRTRDVTEWVRSWLS